MVFQIQTYNERDIMTIKQMKKPMLGYSTPYFLKFMR